MASVLPPSLIGYTLLPLPSHRSPPPSPPPATALGAQTPAQWVETLRSHARSNNFLSALSCYVDMTTAGVPPDNFAFPAALKAAAGLRDLSSGRQLHAAAVKFGYHSSPVTVANTLITMYAKCGDAASAFKVFEEIPHRDQVSWNSMMAALCMVEEWELALEAFRSMQEDGMAPSSFTLVSVALACSNLGKCEGLRLGKQAHGYGLRTGFYSDGKTFTYNALIAMYGKLGMVEDSAALFDLFEYKDKVSWNTLISALVQNDRFVDALALLHQMVLSGIEPDGVTLSAALPACSQLGMLDTGREIHAYALKNDGLWENSFVASALVDMYCNSGDVEKGRKVFDEVLDCRIGLWNAMISGYTQNGADDEALKLFVNMEMDAGLCPNATTLASVLPSAVRSEVFCQKVVKRSLERDKYVQNALMDMYARVGKMEVAQAIFNSMEDRDLVSWNTMITGYVISGLFAEAFDQLIEMQRGRSSDEEGYGTVSKPNNITLMTLLPACASLSALAKGERDPWLRSSEPIRVGCSCGECFGRHVCEMWLPELLKTSVRQNACEKCGHLECADHGIWNAWAWRGGSQAL